MATLEERELVDYTIKKLEKFLEPENFMIKDLDKIHSSIVKTGEKLRKIIEKIESLENRIRSLERREIFSRSSSSSSE